MTQRVSVTHPYDFGVDKVYEAFCEPDFYRAKFEAIGNRNVEILSFDQTQSGLVFRIRRDVRLEVPRMLRSALGEWNTVTQTEEWQATDAGYRSEFELSSALAPIRIGGEMLLSGGANESTNDIATEIKAQVPLIGGKLEALAADGTRESLAAEHDFIQRYLSS